MRKKVGIIFMALGAVLVLAALSLFCMNQREEKLAGEAVDRLMPRIAEQIEEKTPGISASESSELEYPDPYDTEMTEVEIDGYRYIGYLSVPSLGLELPVMSEWDYERLKTSPCRYAGSTKTDDLVIAGHSYVSHFRPLRGLSAGDIVYFTDMDGITSVYEVVMTEVLSPDEVEKMTAGEYDLTLFTCTSNTRSRFTIRCDREK